MAIDRADISGMVGRDTVRSVCRLLLAAVSLVFVSYLATLLPGIDRIAPLTFNALVGVIFTIAIVALLLYSAPKLALLVRMRFDGPQPVVENLSSIVYWVAVLAAVLVAHRRLTGVLTPFPEGIAWLYDVVFLLLALPAVAFVAARLYTSLDPGADLLADTLVGSRGMDEFEGDESDDPASPG